MYVLCIVLGFMIDKMSLFPFLFGIIVGSTSQVSVQQLYEHVLYCKKGVTEICSSKSER